MIKIILLNGFLGAGKTTLLKNILHAYSQEAHAHKIGVIVNEFGEINIDAQHIKKEGLELDVTMTELSNGSIFCACIKDNFVNSLIEMSKQAISYLFIESTGLADPSSMDIILDSISTRVEQPYLYIASISVIDANTYFKLSKLLPVIPRQIQFSNLILINKTDLVNEETIHKIDEDIRTLNTYAHVIYTTQCKFDVISALGDLPPLNEKPLESLNTVESRPLTVALTSDTTLQYEDLFNFVSAIAPSCYRVKGFVLTEKGLVEINAVGDIVSVLPYPEKDDNICEQKLVVISSVGIKIRSVIAEASKKFINGALR